MDPATFTGWCMFVAEAAVVFLAACYAVHNINIIRRGGDYHKSYTTNGEHALYIVVLFIIVVMGFAAMYATYDNLVHPTCWDAVSARTECTR